MLSHACENLFLTFHFAKKKTEIQSSWEVNLPKSIQQVAELEFYFLLFF